MNILIMKVRLINNSLSEKKKGLLLLFCLILFNSCNDSTSMSFEEKQRKYIDNALKDQEEAWNNSNFNDFMSYYLNSKSLLFVNSKGTKYGWRPIYDQISPLFEGEAIPGKIRINPIHIKMISDSMFLVIGEMTFEESDIQERTNCYFSQLWKKYDSDWKIVFDHTTVEEGIQM